MARAQRRGAQRLAHALAAVSLAAWARCVASKEVASGADLTLYLLDAPNAVCNDGSPAGFYFIPYNETSKRDLWLVYLQGGDWCYSAQTCLQRVKNAPALTSSTRWDAHMRLGGIFDADPKRNPWAGANLVYAPYCTSDAWVGDLGHEDSGFGFSFRGQRVIEALFERLQAGVVVTDSAVVKYANHTHGHDTTSATYALTAKSHLLFGGCSAGSRGAAFTLDYVQAMLPPGSPPVLGFLDSALWVDVPPLEPQTLPLANATQAVFGLVNATARLGAACAAAYPGAEGWKCLFGQYRLPFIATPYFLSASQFDKYQLPYNAGYPPYKNATALAYADAFQDAVRSVALSLPTLAQRRSAVYSSACFKHCTSTLAWGAFWGVKVANVSLRDALADWYFGPSWHGVLTRHATSSEGPSDDVASPSELPPGVPSQRIEACNGFGCGQCHAKTAAPAPPLPPAYAMQLLPAATGARIGGGVTSASDSSVAVVKRSGGSSAAAPLAAAAAVAVAACCFMRRRGGDGAADARARASSLGATGSLKSGLELADLGESASLLRAPPRRAP